MVLFSDTKKIAITSLLVLMFLTYTLNLYINLPVKKKHDPDLALQGKKVWQKNNCNACHQLYGLGGYLGADLTNIYSLRGPDHIKIFLKNGTVIMPAFDLTKQDTEALIAFLKHTDAEGNADPRSFRINKNGTIQQ